MTSLAPTRIEMTPSLFKMLDLYYYFERTDTVDDILEIAAWYAGYGFVTDCWTASLGVFDDERREWTDTGYGHTLEELRAFLNEHDLAEVAYLGLGGYTEKGHYRFDLSLSPGRGRVFTSLIGAALPGSTAENYAMTHTVVTLDYLPDFRAGAPDAEEVVSAED